MINSRFYSNINSLKQKLNIKPINTGKMFTSPIGIVFDDMEALHIIGTYDNKAVFKSGTEFTHLHFRGQNKDYGICKANLFRDESKKNIFLEICRTIAFEKLLDKHPYIKLLKTLKIFDLEIYLNNTAIAQHYELKTPYLDLTSNFDVASFFATSSYDKNTRSYIPYNGDSQIGVMYIYDELMDMSIQLQNKDIPQFEYIGWQGLPRPKEQRASIYNLSFHSDFSKNEYVKKYYFKHSPSAAKRIYKKFDCGKTLFPDDSASSLANECKKIKVFTQNEIEQAINRYKYWVANDISETIIHQFINDLNIAIVENSALNWDNLVDNDESFWLKKFDETFKECKYRLSSSHIDL